jgi:hypothetical protein
MHAVMGHGDLQVENDVSGFASNVLSVVVFTGHHEFGAFFADFFENAVVSSLQQFVGVTAFLGMVLAIFNRSEQFSAGIGRGGEGLLPTAASFIRFLIETASRACVTGNITGLVNAE